MLRTHLRDDELLLRQEAAKGNYKKVKEILERNKGADSFDVNGGSSNGNTALHWACAKVMETKQGLSERYAKTIRLLVQYGADHLIENKFGQNPRDFFPDGGGFRNSSHTSRQLKSSGYLALINALLEIECIKITSPEERECELKIETSFYLILDELKPIDFFSSENKQQDTFTVLSLACGLSMEILPLIMYFQYQNKKVKYIGVDINSDIIEDNKARYNAYENVNFICADASNLDEINTIVASSSIEMGIIRNGDFTESNGRKDIFCKMVDQILPRLLKPDAPLLMTFQTEHELNICSKETQLFLNFKKFKGDNLCDMGELCPVPIQRGNDTIITYSDLYSFILNADKTNAVQDQLSHGLQRLRM